MSTFKKPDLNAPRYKTRSVNILTPKLFAKFKKKHPKYTDLDYSTFKNIIYADNINIWKAASTERDGVELRDSLGYIFVGSCPAPTKKINIDFGKSIKAGHTVIHKNWDTDGLIGKIVYSNYGVKYKVRHRQLWSFVATRDFTRAVAKEYPANYKKYIVIEDSLNISKLFMAQKAKDRSADVRGYFEKKAERELVNYDEFNLD